MPEVTTTIRSFTDVQGRKFAITIIDGKPGASVSLTQPSRGYGMNETPEVSVDFEMPRATAIDVVIALGGMIDSSLGRTGVLSQSEAYMMTEIAALRSKLAELRAEVERHAIAWKAHT